jgi:hypothetical protein
MRKLLKSECRSCALSFVFCQELLREEVLVGMLLNGSAQELPNILQQIGLGESAGMTVGTLPGK